MTNKRKTAILANVAATAFASAPATPKAAPAAPATPKAAPAAPATPKAAPATDAAKAARVAPVLTNITAAVPMPERKGRGSVSVYPFADLTVGGSFGVKNKTAKDLATIVSNANRKYTVDKVDETGAKVFKTKTVQGEGGATLTVPTEEVEKVNERHFFAHDCDPAGDPDGASVRIFRDK